MSRRRRDRHGGDCAPNDEPGASRGMMAASDSERGAGPDERRGRGREDREAWMDGESSTGRAPSGDFIEWT